MKIYKVRMVNRTFGYEHTIFCDIRAESRIAAIKKAKILNQFAECTIEKVVSNQPEGD